MAWQVVYEFNSDGGEYENAACRVCSRFARAVDCVRRIVFTENSADISASWMANIGEIKLTDNKKAPEKSEKDDYKLSRRIESLCWRWVWA